MKRLFTTTDSDKATNKVKNIVKNCNGSLDMRREKWYINWAVKDLWRSRECAHILGFEGYVVRLLVVKTFGVYTFSNIDDFAEQFRSADVKGIFLLTCDSNEIDIDDVNDLTADEMQSIVNYWKKCRQEQREAWRKEVEQANAIINS